MKKIAKLNIETGEIYGEEPGMSVKDLQKRLEKKDEEITHLKGELKVTQEDLAKAEKKILRVIDEVGNADTTPGINLHEFILAVEEYLQTGNAKIFEKETAVEAEEYAEEEN